MELRHLRYFVAVAEELHFRRAAERLHISQPPLSLQISQLEEEVGAKLFERTRQRVLLTAAGRTFLVHAQQILRHADTAKHAASLAARGEAGELRIGFTQSVKFIPRFLKTLKEFRRRFPGVALSMQEMDSVTQINALVGRRIELGLMPQPHEPVVSTVKLSTLMVDPMVLATAQDGELGQRTSVAVQDLKAQPLICTPRFSGFGLHQHLTRICWARGFVPDVIHESDTLASIVVLVATGLGSAVLPQSIATIGVPGVAYVPFAQGEAVVNICVARHADHEDSLALQLHRMLDDAAD
ncbi:MAG: LysR substrate-binding domain-containing protein [Pseudomonadota bacterium]